jgi:hypothetical protein
MMRSEKALVEKQARRVAPGDLLVLADLSTTPVLSVEPAGRGRVVMITTDGDHLFFAGDAPVLGHNIQPHKSDATATTDFEALGNARGVGYGG